MIHTMIFQSLPLGYSFQQCEFLGSRRIPRDWAEIFLHPCSVSFQTVSDWELPSFLCAPLRGKHRCWACGKYRTQILKNQTWSDFTAVKRIPKGENKDVLSFLLFSRSKLEVFFVCVYVCVFIIIIIGTARLNPEKSQWYIQDLVPLPGYSEYAAQMLC